MLMTRALYLILFLVNLAVNGLALLHLTGVFPTDAQIIPGALLFNLVILPVALFAAYRMGGMTEEIYRKKEHAALAAASTQQQKAATASHAQDTRAKSPAASKLDATTTSGNAAKPVDARQPQRQNKPDAAAKHEGSEAAGSAQASGHGRKT